MPTETNVQYDSSLMGMETTTATTLAVTNAPTAAQLAKQAADLRAQAIKQAEQDVKDAEQLVCATAVAHSDAVHSRAAARQSLREIKAGPKRVVKPGAGETRKPRGASRAAVAGALNPAGDAKTTTN